MNKCQLLDAQPLDCKKVEEALDGPKYFVKRFLDSFAEAYHEGVQDEKRGNCFDTAFELAFDSPWPSGSAFWGEEELYDFADFFIRNHGTFDPDSDPESVAKYAHYDESQDITFFLGDWPLDSRRKFFLVRYDWKDGAELTGWWLEASTD